MSKLVIDVELADGTTHADLAISNRAMVDFDFERNQMKWPDAQAAPFLWLTYLAWRQLGYDGELDKAVKFRTFREELCVDIDRKDKGEAQAADALDPSQEAAEQGSASP